MSIKLKNPYVLDYNSDPKMACKVEENINSLLNKIFSNKLVLSKKDINNIKEIRKLGKFDVGVGDTVTDEEISLAVRKELLARVTEFTELFYDELHY